MRTRILTVINNFGEEKYIVQYTILESYWFFWTREVWKSVTFTQTNDPFFYDEWGDAYDKCNDLLANGNPRKQKVITITSVKEITI